MTTFASQCSIGISFLLLTVLSGQAAAQLPPPSWKKDFDDVTIDHIEIEDLPSAEESMLPGTLGKISALPRPASMETLRKTSSAVSDRVVEVIVVEDDSSPVKRTPVVVRGEAVWLSTKKDGADPVLVTNAHWVMNAKAVFIRLVPKRAQGKLPAARKRSISEMSLGADVRALLNDPKLIAVDLRAIDKHRNLAVIVPRSDKVPMPAAGLQLFPIDDEALAAIYGFSHQMGSTLVQAIFLTPRAKKTEILYYLHTTYPVILGAPLMSDDGRVVALTAMRHPTESERTLAIPPRALRTYLEKVQAGAADPSGK